uniref:Glutaredoxin domain-containing protein n=1 Tax=Kalanchoe fedtschenkoi TaxID=63787 RepID=A0A7N0RER5_KALFE
MGCMSSKKARCPHCQNAPFSPAVRSYSMPVHHPPDKRGDSYHVVALTSSTLGSLELNRCVDESHKGVSERVGFREKASEEFMEGVREGKAWSQMIEEKIPKLMAPTPGATTPPGEPETINAWELMEGLEDSSPMRPQKHFKSFSFAVIRDPVGDASLDQSGSRLPDIEEARRKSIDLVVQENEKSSSPAPRMNMNGTQPAVELDSKTLCRKSFEELSPDNPFHLRPEDSVKPTSAVSAISTVSLDDDKPLGRTAASADDQPLVSAITDYKSFSFGKDKVVVYFTSLRGVRKTYEDSLHVRVILKGLGLRVDERDMSMHSGFKDELKSLMGNAFRGAALPRVFIGKKYIGGADEIRRLNEDGQLEKTFQGCQLESPKCGAGTDITKPCDACGDVRFVPCDTCSGSCKIYYDRDDYSDESLNRDSDHTDDDGSDGFGFQRCPDCNENGLIRCPICCY